MTEVSTIYQTQMRISAPLTTLIPPSQPPPERSRSRQEEEEEARGGSRSHDRGFQIRQGSFKLNALRLPKPVARFVIMQVIFSCGCALLGILSVAFRCWMAYLCIPVIVGAMELLIGIIGYTAIKRPHKKILVKCYFIGCLIGSLAALGLVVFSIIGAATEQEYQCVLLPNVFAECNAVRVRENILTENIQDYVLIDDLFDFLF
ncbi:uncharacterized protein [Diadema antillarum]|uniref:uncharacterized protein n=1 Tax=Diadema antillarum TaxID=105358 RepID=UPI003A852AB4